MNRLTPVVRAHGFTLAELAITLGLSSLLLGGLLPTLSAQRAATQERETSTRIEIIREALLGFAQVHGHLPCPADPRIRSGNASAGVARALVSGDCAGGYVGAIPWATLGVPELDAWGRRFTYRVARDMANDLNECVGRDDRSQSICFNFAPAASHHATVDSLEVRDRSTAGVFPAGSDPIATGLAFVIISHGVNGFEGYDAAGTQIGNAASGENADEQRNASLTTTTFFARMPTPDSSRCSDTRASSVPCGFDDSIGWSSRGEVLASLVRAGRLP